MKKVTKFFFIELLLISQKFTSNLDICWRNYVSNNYQVYISIIDILCYPLKKEIISELLISTNNLDAIKSGQFLITLYKPNAKIKCAISNMYWNL